MAKDELAALGLDDDEIELIKSRRKQRRIDFQSLLGRDLRRESQSVGRGAGGELPGDAGGKQLHHDHDESLPVGVRFFEDIDKREAALS